MVVRHRARDRAAPQADPTDETESHPPRTGVPLDDRHLQQVAVRVGHRATVAYGGVHHLGFGHELVRYDPDHAQARSLGRDAEADARPIHVHRVGELRVRRDALG